MHLAVKEAILFGCRLLDGAYFCGDHPCATYKHIGQKATTRSTQVAKSGLRASSSQ